MSTKDVIFVGFNKRVAALDRKTGEIIWQWKASDGHGFVSLLLDGDRLFVSVNGYMYCLEAATGKLLSRFHSDGAIYSSPVIDDNAVYFGNNSGSFISLNYRSGGAL